MIQVFINNGLGDVDYTKYVDFSTISIVYTINAPTTCTFNMTNWDANFVLPPGRSYVRIHSTKFNRSLYTGVLANAPNQTYQGLKPNYNQDTNQLFVFQFQFQSDEYLLNLHTVPFIPAFVNMYAGDILRLLGNILMPGFYDYTYCAQGQLIPFLAYDPTKSWSEYAKQFGDAGRFRYSVIDKQIHYQPYGDGKLGVSYDENQPESQFDATQLETSALTTPIVNDITIIGAQEAGNNHEDYFIGDGFTSAFALRHQVFNGGGQSGGGSAAGSVLLDDTWSETDFDTTTWQIQDPESNFSLVDGELNIVTSNIQEAVLGTSYIQANNAVELAGGVVLQHGEFTFNNSSSGIVGGLYTNQVLDPQSCLCGFEIADGAQEIVVTASGASGIGITPFAPNSPVAFNPITVYSKINKTYTLTTTISSPAASRYTQAYTTLGGVVFGAASLYPNIVGTITWTIEEIDIFTGEITTYTGSLPNQNLPAFAIYGLINNQALNLNVNQTEVYTPPLGSLNIECEIGAGLLGPIYVSGNLQYTGAYVTPSGGNLPIYPSNLGPEQVFQLGGGLENQSAEIDLGTTYSTLNFYSDDIPGVGVRIRLNSWESQASLSRVQASGSIAEEQQVAGDDGIRASVVTNLTPQPRTSEDCDAAAAAFLTDRTNVFYQGSYTANSLFFNNNNNDIEFWPQCGRYLYINAPQRGISKQKLLVSSLTTTILEGKTEVFQFSISFGPDLKLEKTLANFVNAPTNVLLPQDTAITLTPQQLAQIGDSYLPDVISTRIASETITGEGCNIVFSDNMSGFTGTVLTAEEGITLPFYEVRDNDLNWGINNSNILARIYDNGNYYFARDSFEQLWYIRFVQLDTNGNVVAVSRRSKVLRIYAPQTPTMPLFLYADSTTINCDYSGDIRNIEGIELRAATLEQIISIGAVSSGTRVPIYDPVPIVPITDGQGRGTPVGGVPSLPIVSAFGGVPVFAIGEVYYDAIVGSEEDMAFDLNTLRGNTGTGNTNINGGLGTYQKGIIPPLQRSFAICFFNTMWEYSLALIIDIPIPPAPVLTLDYVFGPNVQVGLATISRTDMQWTTLEVSSDPDFTNILQTLQQTGEPSFFAFALPTSGDVYVRCQYEDYISDGPWSDTLTISQKDLVNSSYLSSQGSIPPTITAVNGNGGLFTYQSSDDQIQIANFPFSLVFPDGDVIEVPETLGTFNESIEKPTVPLLAATNYGFFPALLGPTTANPNVQFNGPWAGYASYSAAPAFTGQLQDGACPLTDGPLVIATAAAGIVASGSFSASGGYSAGGSGGGTTGGTNCGVGSSRLTLADGSKIMLKNAVPGTLVKNKLGKTSRIIARSITKSDTVTWETDTRKSRTGPGHAVFCNNKWRFLEDIVDSMLLDQEEQFVLNDDGDIEKIMTIVVHPEKTDIYHIELVAVDSTIEDFEDDGWHVYILDGFFAHNVVKVTGA